MNEQSLFFFSIARVGGGCVCVFIFSGIKSGPFIGTRRQTMFCRSSLFAPIPAENRSRGGIGEQGTASAGRRATNAQLYRGRDGQVRCPFGKAEKFGPRTAGVVERSRARKKKGGIRLPRGRPNPLGRFVQEAPSGDFSWGPMPWTSPLCFGAEFWRPGAGVGVLKRAARQRGRPPEVSSAGLL